MIASLFGNELGWGVEGWDKMEVTLWGVRDWGDVWWGLRNELGWVGVEARFKKIILVSVCMSHKTRTWRLAWSGGVLSSPEWPPLLAFAGGGLAKVKS